MDGRQQVNYRYVSFLRLIDWTLSFVMRTIEWFIEGSLLD